MPLLGYDTSFPNFGMHDRSTDPDPEFRLPLHRVWFSPFAGLVVFFFFCPFASLTRSYSSSYIGTRDPLELELAQPRGGTYWGFWKKKRGTGGWGSGRIRESTGA